MCIRDRCGTPLSSHEVAQGYKDVKERSAIAKFKVKDEDAYILAWTTTPWTLPSNVALCVHPDERYVKVRMNGDGTVYYLAEALADTVLGEGAYTVLEAYTCLLYTSHSLWYNPARSQYQWSARSLCALLTLKCFPNNPRMIHGSACVCLPLTHY